MKYNQQRAKNLITVLTVLLIFEILTLIITVFTKSQNLSSLETNTEESFSETMINLLPLIYLILFVTSGILFIQWFRRAYFNHHVLDFVSRYEEGAAAWSWIVPFYNLVAPYRIMKELWIDFQKDTDKVDLTLLNVWWGLWIMSSFISNVESKIPEPNEYFLTVTYFSLVFSIAANIAVLQVVKKVAFNEHELYKNFNSEKDILEHLLSD
jgi:Domain of unknown function (DUF4328)